MVSSNCEASVAAASTSEWPARNAMPRRDSSSSNAGGSGAASDEV